MAFPDFKIGAAAIMANQPSSIQFVPAQPTFQRLSGGGYVASPRAQGARVVVTWGVDVASDGAYDELVTDLGGTPGTPGSINLAHTITWEDPAGNAFSVDVVVEDISQQFGPAQLFQAFSVTFFQRPA